MSVHWTWPGDKGHTQMVPCHSCGQSVHIKSGIRSILRRSELRSLKTFSVHPNGNIWRAYQWTHPESQVPSTRRMGTASGNKRKTTPDCEWVERISVKAWNFLSHGPQPEKGVAWGIICRYIKREQPISTQASQLIPKDRVNPGTLYTSLG